ncbi:ABC transporter substrate-binding protein [Haloarchaeobius amylolyticus]|uniref:ABC transporter substrate-binding protein n=1 Tax=Haloarchaeobius amylolyticus TaxID=1198296 RepID=A0ABD6BES8_9EURY
MDDSSREHETTGDGGAGRRRGLERRQVLKTTAGGAVGLSLAGCLDTYGAIIGDDDTEPITVGVLAPGPDSDTTGQSNVRGAQIAVDELNDDGGILGREVELAVGDSNRSAREGSREYQRLVLEEGADVTVGVATSEVLEGILDDVAEQETIHLTAGAVTMTPSELIGEQYDEYKYHFRVGPLNGHDLAAHQLDFLDAMGGELGWESFAVLVEDYIWTESLWDVYEDELSGDVTFWEQYPPATDDFTDIYDEIATTDADAVLEAVAHTGATSLVDWNRTQQPFAFGGVHMPMQSPLYYDQVGGDCEYAVGYTNVTPTSDHTEKTQPFIQEYQDRYDGNSPVYTGYSSYDAVHVFAQAAEAAGTLDSDELVSTLEDISVTGTTGTIEFYGADHEFAHDVVYGEDNVNPVYFQWVEDENGDGVQNVIWPDEQAESDYVEPDWI